MSHDFTSKLSAVGKLSALGDDEATLVVAESKSFVEFDAWMDVQLAILVAQWAHTAAPNAQRAEWRERRINH